ncbi:hypothetical protein B0H11DRAFT_1915246 [Mycena galericulata]|nr:hypothetical protein B0H11DRAFT_1915246 [Mycena galericulata]
MHHSFSHLNHFQSFRRPTPLVTTHGDGHGVGWLSDAYQELGKINRDGGKLCTWDHGIIGGWIEVPMPRRIIFKGQGSENIWPRDNSPFFCPHKKANGWLYKPLVLRIGGLYNGGVADYFQAVDHSCVFKIVVRPRKEGSLVSWEDQQKYEEEDADDCSSTPVSPCEMSSIRTPTLSSLAISHFALQAMLNPDPRYGSHCVPAPGASRPTATPVMHGVVSKSSFFSLSVANARKNADMDAMGYIHQLDVSERPAAHLAWNMDEPHPILRVYDNRIYPNCLQRTYNNLNFLYKPLGQAIRDLNSAMGIPYHDYVSLVRSTRSCNGCKGHFSVDGYNAHVQDCKCTNHPDLSLVDECEASCATFQFRYFKAGLRPKKVQDTLDTPVGAALLEWNSRIGVPIDVWIVISTAIILCERCDLVRSFSAHLLHLEEGVCNDPGQLVIGPGNEG